MTLNIHLSFDGTCKEAFEFYANVLGQPITFIQTYGESPMASEVKPEMHGRVMHASIMAGSHQLMGADAFPGQGVTYGGFGISINTEDPAEAERLYAALSEGGKADMPLQETFWAQRFGSLTDKFGVPWMVNCGKPGF